MFGPKKPKISKKDLKQSIVNANDRLKAANARMEVGIAAGKEKITSVSEDYTAYQKALEDTKEMQVFANNELEGTQVEISEAQSTVKKALSRLAKLTEESNSLERLNKSLEEKADKLFKAIALLESRKDEMIILTADVKQLREEAATGQEKLELLAIELNEMEAGVESYISRKKAAEGEFNAFKEKIEREKSAANEELGNIKDRMTQATLECGREMGRLDKAIAERISELQDMDMKMQKKTYHLSAIQSSISSVEERVKDAEERIEYSIKKEEERVGKIKGDFKDWKVQALDDIAKKKVKGQIDNIDKAGLKDILNG
jgi:chromosome segregation ATPase